MASALQVFNPLTCEAHIVFSLSNDIAAVKDAFGNLRAEAETGNRKDNLVEPLNMHLGSAETEQDQSYYSNMKAAAIMAKGLQFQKEEEDPTTQIAQQLLCKVASMMADKLWPSKLCSF